MDINHRVVRGEYLHIEPPHRVVFSWGDAGSAVLPPGATHVEVQLEAAAGGTNVTLRHHGLAGDQLTDHARGWPRKLADLADAV